MNANPRVFEHGHPESEIMTRSHDGISVEKLSSSFGMALMLVALILLLAATMDADAVGRLIPAFRDMGFNTQLVFALSGACLLASGHPRLTRILGGLLALLAFTAVCQYFFDLYPTDGRWQYLVNTQADTPWPGRMSLATALAFLAAGAIQVLRPHVRESWEVALTHALLIAMFLPVLIGLAGFMMDFPTFPFERPKIALMSLPTAIGLLLLNFAFQVQMAQSEGYRAYFARYPDRQILSVATMLLLVLLLVGGMLSVTLVGRFETEVFHAASHEEQARQLRNMLWGIVLLDLLLAALGALLLHRYVLPLARALRETRGSLKESLRQNQLILQNVGDGIYGMDRQGRVTFVNEAAERLLGYTLEEFPSGMSHTVMHHSRKDGTAYPCEECPIIQTLLTGKANQEDCEVFWRKDGQALDVEYASTPILENGEVTGAVVVFRDVGERKRSAAALSRWRHIFEYAEWGVMIGSGDGKVLEMMNPAFARMHGYSVEELTGRPTVDIVAPEGREVLEETIRIAHEKGHHVWESWHLRRDGSCFPVQIDATAVKDAEGQVRFCVVNAQDISARKEREELLRRSEAMLAQAQAQAMLGSWRLDISQNILEWSDEIYRIFDLQPGTPLTYEIFLSLVHPDDREFVDQAWQASLNGKPYDIQHRLLVDGKVKWVRESAHLEFSPEGHLWRGIGTSQDITKMKENEEALLRSRQELRDLAAHHEKIREAERGRIAREIHDELGQYLTALRIDAAMLSIRYGTNQPELARHADSMKASIDTTISVVRNLAASLRPAALDMGLVSAAEWLLAGVEKRTGIHCRLETPEDEELLFDDERATAVFRILQESLTNITRHSGASQVNVRIVRREAALEIEVRDNGVGFDPNNIRVDKSFGLMGIRERALMLGGESRIDSAPGAGTTLRVQIPLPDSP